MSFACWPGFRSLADRNDCWVLSQPPISSFRKWNKTQGLKPHHVLPSACRSPIPSPFLWVQSHPHEAPGLTEALASETERVAGPAQPVSQLP